MWAAFEPGATFTLQLRDGTLDRLRRQGSLPLPFYPSFDVEDDPMSGFTDGVSPPRYSSGYFVQRNRFGVLVETHSWKDYATRVRITRLDEEIKVYERDFNNERIKGKHIAPHTIQTAAMCSGAMSCGSTPR